MPDPLPPALWRKLVEFVDDLRAGKWPSGARVLVNFAPDGTATSLEATGRVENRETRQDR